MNGEARARSAARLVGVALAGSVVLAAAKFVASAAAGSTGLLAEAVHSTIAAASQALMLVGLRRAKPAYPSGELAFWCQVAAMLLFGLGAGIAISTGALRLAGPGALADPRSGYMVLAAAAIVVGWTLSSANAACRAIGPGRRAGARPDAAGVGPALALLRTECAAGVLGLAIAAAGLFVATGLDVVHADSIAAILIGLVMAFAAARAGLDVRRWLAVDRRAPGAEPAAMTAPMPLMGAGDDAAKPVVRNTGATARGNYPPAKQGRKHKKRRR